MTSDILGEDNPMTVDKYHRPIYGFLGYAALRADSGLFPPMPSYSETLTSFVGLHNYIQRRWTEQKEQPPEYVLPSQTIRPNIAQMCIRTVTGRLNDDPQQRVKWPDGRRGMRYLLWQLASLHRRPISLCLALARVEDANDGPFLNSTVVNLTRKERVTKADAKQY